MGETLQTEQVPRMSQLKMNLYWYACLEKEFSQSLSLVQVKAGRQIYLANTVLARNLHLVLKCVLSRENV